MPNDEGFRLKATDSPGSSEFLSPLGLRHSGFFSHSIFVILLRESKSLTLALKLVLPQVLARFRADAHLVPGLDEPRNGYLEVPPELGRFVGVSARRAGGGRGVKDLKNNGGRDLPLGGLAVEGEDPGLRLLDQEKPGIFQYFLWHR